ncbi:MAG: hypothetical protein DRI57_22175 [Deltaproteobacteria bacterium]|nr:MAG: hypothetical protein DRI57_22175 [Deltaproteobacteria bacterium]
MSFSIVLANMTTSSVSFSKVSDLPKNFENSWRIIFLSFKFVAGSNAFCGFRYEPQMNADKRRHHLRSSAICEDINCLKSRTTTKSVRIRFVDIVFNKKTDYNEFREGTTC